MKNLPLIPLTNLQNLMNLATELNIFWTIQHDCEATISRSPFDSVVIKGKSADDLVTRMLYNLKGAELFSRIHELGAEELEDEICIRDRKLPIVVDTENVMSDGHSLLGRIVINDIPLYGVYIGGDWEYPIYCAIYTEGEAFQILCPLEWNWYNRATMEAYGNHEEMDLDDEMKSFGISHGDDHDLSDLESELIELLRSRYA